MTSNSKDSRGSFMWDNTVQRECEAPAELLPAASKQEIYSREEVSDFRIRKRPGHGVHISANNPTIVYLTVCCDNRRPWLASDRHHMLLVDIWQDASHWVVGRYVLMPDHLHLFAAPQESAVELDRWVKYWKSQFTKRNRDPSCIWQTGHWDTRIRNLAHYKERSQYLRDNPMRAKSVAAPELLPYQGIVHELRWD